MCNFAVKQKSKKMNNFGLLRTAAATPVVRIAKPVANAEEIIALCDKAAELECSLTVFPELSLSGCTCADLFNGSELIDECEAAAAIVLGATAEQQQAIVFGAPVRYKGRLFNCAIVAKEGEILGIVPKSMIAGNGESRWFESASSLGESAVCMDYAGQSDVLFGSNLIFRIGEAEFGVVLGADMESPVPVSTELAIAGAQIIVNPRAESEYRGRNAERKTALAAASQRICSACVMSSCGYGESTQDYVWAGSAMIYENGTQLAESRRFQRSGQLTTADIDLELIDNLRAKDRIFSGYDIYDAIETVDGGEAAETDFESTLLRPVDAHPFLPAEYSETMPALVNALCTRMEHIGCKKAVIGVSGGLDSTLALLVTAKAFDEMGLPRENITGITMPGFGTSDRTHDNSSELMRLLGISSREISIVPATRQHFSDLGHDESVHDLTYENSQARERTQILMDLAGKLGGIVIGTGDLSELALGWCTYNGDHMSMYSVNAGVPKTLVHALVMAAAEREDCPEELAAVLKDIADTPISPELVPTDKNGEIKQKTEDLVGPYELHDFFIYNYLHNSYSQDKLLLLAMNAFEGKYSKETIEHWLNSFFRRFRSQQFKRSCLPDGPKVESISLSPRGGWKMPSDL